MLPIILLYAPSNCQLSVGSRAFPVFRCQDLEFTAWHCSFGIICRLVPVPAVDFSVPAVFLLLALHWTLNLNYSGHCKKVTDWLLDWFWASDGWNVVISLYMMCCFRESTSSGMGINAGISSGLGSQTMCEARVVFWLWSLLLDKRKLTTHVISLQWKLETSTASDCPACVGPCLTGNRFSEHLSRSPQSNNFRIRISCVMSKNMIVTCLLYIVLYWREI